MKKEILKIYLPLFLTFLVSLFLYNNFQNYRPKILKQIQEVKGYKSLLSVEVPYPFDIEKISLNQTSESSQLTFKTKKSPEDVQKFYRNIFLESGWALELLTNNESFVEVKYKNEGRLVSIISSKDSDSTIVSVAVYKR